MKKNTNLIESIHEDNDLETTIFGQPIDQLGLVDGDLNIEKLKHSQIIHLIQETKEEVKNGLMELESTKLKVHFIDNVIKSQYLRILITAQDLTISEIQTLQNTKKWYQLLQTKKEKYLLTKIDKLNDIYTKTKQEVNNLDKCLLSEISTETKYIDLIVEEADKFISNFRGISYRHSIYKQSLNEEIFEVDFNIRRNLIHINIKFLKSISESIKNNDFKHSLDILFEKIQDSKNFEKSYQGIYNIAFIHQELLNIFKSIKKMGESISLKCKQEALLQYKQSLTKTSNIEEK